MSDYHPDTFVAKVGRALVGQLGDGWSVDTDASFQHGCYLDGPDVRLYLRDVDPVLFDDRTGRIEISTSLPASIPAANARFNEVRAHVRPDSKKITVDGGRPIEAIAADVARRILPAARTLHANAVAYLAERVADATARHAVRDTLLTMLGSHPEVGWEAASDTETTITAYTEGKTGGARGEWWLNHDGTEINLKLTGLTAHQARQIAVLLYRATPRST